MMSEIFYDVELSLGIMLGVVLLVCIGITDSKLRRQERENHAPKKWA
jgi:hypothetical protein